MRTWTWIVVAALACAAAGAGQGSAARAEDPVEAQKPTTLRYDVRVVRISVPAKTVESAPSLPSTNDLGVSNAPWSELLAALQKRGTTQVVMDRSTTSLPGHAATLGQTQIWNVLTTRRADAITVNREAAPVNVGADAQLVTSAAPSGIALQYEAKVTWIVPNDREYPKLETASWRGAIALESAGTLVLRHAQQDDANQGTEIYVLISWRR